MSNRFFMDARIRVEKRENNELYFIPEVLIYNSMLEWEDQQILQRKHGGYSTTYNEWAKLYIEFYGKTTEWCVVSKNRSIYRESYISLDRRYGKIDQKKIGFKTLKSAKGALNAFKERYKDHL
jgi:hypothetical protein